MIDHFKVNTIGPIHLFNAFMPLILKGEAKKVFAISTGEDFLGITQLIKVLSHFRCQCAVRLGCEECGNDKWASERRAHE